MHSHDEFPPIGNGLFSIRGSLDGELEQEYNEREQFIGLRIDKEEFYLPIALVNEIVMLQPITYVPQCPKYVEGVINLRGHILPAINLRKMLGLGRTAVTPATRIIIARQGELLVGLIVDGITYVMSLVPSEIETQLLLGRGTGVDLISRISKSGEQITGILDLSKIIYAAADGKLSSEALQAASEPTEAAS